MKVTAVKERPILFSAPMVNAILEGRKTQTRRLLKPAPMLDRILNRETGPDDAGWLLNDNGLSWRYDAMRKGAQIPQCGPYTCPYGKPGERLWVRETWNIFAFSNDGDEHWPLKTIPKEDPREEETRRHFEVDYAASTDEAGPWRPSIHMPRWASRIDLAVSNVRVQRLQEITADDACAEGCAEKPGEDVSWSIFNFMNLWNSINGTNSWNCNPWVWVVDFKRVQP